MTIDQHSHDRVGLSLIELLVVITVIAVLIGLLMPAVSLVRQRAKTTEARQVVSQLGVSLETYSNEDRRHRYPLQEQLYPTPAIAIPHPFAVRPQAGAAGGLLTMLRAVGVNTGQQFLDPDGCMLDPWGGRYQYQLTRPTPPTPAGALQDWNWDADRSQPKRWADRTNTPAPFPYVWSLGPKARSDDATGWLYDPKS